MQIRLAVREDVGAVLELLRRIVPSMRAAGNLQWDESYPCAAVFEHDVEQRQLWVAATEGAFAGMVAITTGREPDYGHAGWDVEEDGVMVHRLAVDPEFRGAGLAAALMRKAEEVAAERGLPVVRTDTSIENEAAQKLFLKLGYRKTGEIRLSFRPGLRVLCYEKRLD
ncbi:MAG TPA: GNAT family N-acetyltransferase [Edaphobacter sp.]|uniref:GNAT family N-acetyltransferase n=1 Tax=Edaphobacter sp. TaxID=1934404 RepID=UPI002BF10AA8|nr:GNAT family N-acetyltransferase [Edaphobacter sp.]HUZ97438.1 GNAT family N-acetyltransferase [Edaphobacter sp.]